jgi:hypothetical protein
MTEYNPKFLQKNFINNVDTIVDSAATSDQNKRFLYDRKPRFQWESIGETSGTRTITWTPSSSKTVTRIWLQNINWKDFTIKYNTTNNFTPAIAVTGNSDENIYIQVDSQAVNNIVFSITDTITASVTAKAGQIYVGAELFEIDSVSGGRLNEAVADVRQTMIPLSDGRFNKVFINDIVNWQLGLVKITAANRQNYIDLYDRNRREPFAYIPYPKTQSDVWDGIANHYDWANAPDYYNYFERIKDNDFEINIILQQNGGV